MSSREFIGRAIYYVLKPFAGSVLKNSRRAYVVVQHEGEVLVVKNVIGTGKWHLPGGGCHKNETYAQGAVRELKEEVGIATMPSELTQLSQRTFRSKRNFDYQLFSLSLRTVVDLRLDRIEILEAAWVKPDELTRSNAGESTLEAVAQL